MRIRRHAARILSALSISTQPFAAATASAEAPAAATVRELDMHVCELNQSPWDAMAFTPPGSAPLYHYKVWPEVEVVMEENGFVGGATGSGQIDEERADAVSDVSGVYAAQSTLRCQLKMEAAAAGAEEGEKTERKIAAKKRNSSDNTKKVKRKTTSSCAMEGAEEANGKLGLESAAAAAAVATCKKSDGKGWHCKREAQYPHSLCEYHLIQVRSYYSNGGSSTHVFQQQQQQPLRMMHGEGIVDAKQNAASIPDKKNIKKKKQTKKKDNSGKSSVRSNVDAASRRRRKPAPSDFYYYYSGFGPWWGKRRSDGGGAGDRDGGERAASNVDMSGGDDDGVRASNGAPPPRVHDQAPDDLDDDDDDDDDTDGVADLGGYDGPDVIATKGRGRKPIKARSLKSLL